MDSVSLLSHLTDSALVVYVLQYLKGTRGYRRFAAWVPIADQKVHVLMSALGAGLTSFGIHWAVQGTAAAGWHLALTIPPLWVLLTAIWEWGKQLALNQLVFAVAVQQKEAAPVVTQQITPKVAVTQPLDAVVAAKG